MNFFNLSVKNIKKNFRSYITYFICTVFSVIAFYMFYAICFNKQFEILQDESVKLAAAFSTSSVIIALFSAIFIWYSNSFFIKRRKKEIGIYSLLGMGKRQIARMLFFESLILGVAALTLGIFLGTLFSKLFAMILMRVMKETAEVTFFISPKAVGITIAAFLLIFIIISLHSYSLIYRFRLIDLFNAQKQGEKAPKVSVILSLLSVAMIGSGYIMAFTLKKVSMSKLLFILAIVVIGTYILFSNLIIFLVKLIRKNKNYYFSGVNMIGISNILYRIKGNSRTLATIAVLSAVTITAVGTTYTLYSTIYGTTLSNYPYSAEYKLTGKDTDEKIDKIIMKHSEVDISSVDNIEYLKAALSIPGYTKTSSADSFDGYVLSESQYNEIVMHNKSNRTVNLENESECLFIDKRYDPESTSQSKGKTVTLKAADTSEMFVIQDTASSTVMSFQNAKATIVVKDSVYDKLHQNQNIESDRFRGYMFGNPLKSEKLKNDLVSSNLHDDVLLYYDVYKISFRTFGVFVYIGAFLGILFFLATGSIIYFKQLMEAYDDKERYKILKNIGVSRNEIKKSVSKQLLLVFGLPLIVGISHSTFALTILKKFMPTSILKPCLAVMAVYLVFYVIYYFATVSSFVRTVDTAN